MAAFQRFLNATTATLPRQCASAGFLFATGDCIAQQVVEKKGSKHDIIRTARLTAYGGLIFSPIAAFWLGKVLERVPYKGLAGTVTKVALDQSIAAPSLLALFFTSTTLMEGKSIDDVKTKLKKVGSIPDSESYQKCLQCDHFLPLAVILEHTANFLGRLDSRSIDQYGIRSTTSTTFIRKRGEHLLEHVLSSCCFGRWSG